MDTSPIIGRKAEIETLKKLYKSNKSEFVAIYGRRRIGKTFLVKKLFADKYTFQVTGLSNADFSQQLANFYMAITRLDQNYSGQEVPQNWLEAFDMLIGYIQKSRQSRKIIFIDELPWMDTPRSDFLSALEHFWNGWASHRNDILLIGCGSAASWMINEIINNHGGLHNRVTARIHLHPFTLNEAEAFLQSKGGVYTRYEIIQLYMAIGGIPFYLENVDTAKSVEQNIDLMFFSQNGFLRSEYFNLYRSLFKKYERHMAIIEALAERSRGLSRKELIKLSGLSDGGTFSNILEELEQCGFIKRYLPFGKKLKDSLYQLTDPYSLFYLKFVKNSKADGQGAWLTQMDNPKWKAWSGYAYEYLCRYHIGNIKKHLGIGAVYTEVSAWRSTQSEHGAQIDLIIDRRDRVINLCEIKFSVDPYVISKSYAEKLRHKLSTFRMETGTTKTLFLTFITTFGLRENKHFIGLVQNSLTMDALFD